MYIYFAISIELVLHYKKYQNIKSRSVALNHGHYWFNPTFYNWINSLLQCYRANSRYQWDLLEQTETLLNFSRRSQLGAGLYVHWSVLQIFENFFCKMVAGIGFPVEVRDESITWGATVKSYYLLPTNSNDFLNPSIADVSGKSRSPSRWEIYSAIRAFLDKYALIKLQNYYH